MSKIVIFDPTGQPVAIEAEVYPDRLVIHGEGGSQTEIHYPVENQLFGDTLFASYDRESQTLNPIPRRQLYASPFAQVEGIAAKANSRLTEIQTFLKNVSQETDPAQLMKQLQKAVKVYNVNLASKSTHHMADVIMDGSGKKIRALVDGGADIGVADPAIFDHSKLKKFPITVTGIGGTSRISAVTVPNVSVFVNNKEYKFEQVDFALQKLQYPVLISADIQKSIEDQEGVTVWN